jgi:two-component system, NarL family, nitrate/nitrite response regulator NarL
LLLRFCHRPCAVCNRGLRQATSNDLYRTVDCGFRLRPQRARGTSAVDGTSTRPGALIEHQTNRTVRYPVGQGRSDWGALRNMAPNQEPQQSVSVVVADDHPVVLRGITEILRAQPDISVVAACSCGRDATAAIQQFTPDVAVLDIIMPDRSGLDVLLSIVGDRFKTRVVLLTAVATEDRVLAAMTSGAKGLLFKDAAPDNLIDCVREVAKGKLWFPHGLVDAAPERESGRQAHGECSIGALTPREAQIALLVSEGLSNKLVAWQLNVAEGTVKVYLHNIFEKLGIPNRTVLCALTIPHRDWLLAAAEHARAKLN